MSRKYLIVYSVLFVSLTTGTPAFSGLDRSFAETLQYDVTGILEVKPDSALFPVTLTAQGNNYVAALQRAQEIYRALEVAAQQTPGERLSVTPGNFDETREYEKVSSLSFFGDEQNMIKTNMQFFLHITFTAQDDFWARAQFIAAALDLLNAQVKAFQAEHTVELRYGEMLLRVSNPEQYREQLMTTLYTRAKAMAQVVAAGERTTPVIKEITCAQTIEQHFLNIHQASLALTANIVFGFAAQAAADAQ